MAGAATEEAAHEGQARLDTFQRLLAIDAIDLQTALGEACQLIVGAFGADKADAFLYDAAVHTLVAFGTSDTPMGRLQHALGLDRLPVANGGRIVETFQTGATFHTGHADRDPEVLRGIKEGMGVRSMVAAAYDVSGQRRGVLVLCSSQPDSFAAADVRLVETVALWVGLVAHRAELVEQVARQAADQARRLAAEELVTVLAHDLRNLLTPIRGRMQMLRRQARSNGHRLEAENAEAALTGLARLERMVADLLDTARLDAGTFSTTPQPVDLAIVAREAAAALETDRVRVVVKGEEQLLACIDPSRVRQALENLIANAVRVSPCGAAVAVCVECERQPDGEWAVVTVCDEGPGIAPETLPRIFDRYGKDAESNGLGLGLYVARRIAEAHGGTLTVRSTVGQGACFRLALPFRAAATCSSPGS